MKKFLALLLAALLLISTLVLTTGCAKSDDKDDDQKTEEKADDKEKADEDEADEDEDDKSDKKSDKKDKKDEDSIVGKWKGKLDVTEEAIYSLFDEDEDWDDYFDFDDVSVVIIAEFDEDGTNTVSVDEDATADSMNDFVDTLEDGLLEYLMYANGVETEEELEEVLGVNIDDALENAFAGAVEQLTGGVSIEEGVEELGEDLYKEGEYEFEDGEVTLIDSDNEIEFSKDSFTLIGENGEEAEFERID